MPRLETLDLGHGWFGNAGALVLIDKAASFEHLAQIDLTHQYVNAELQSALKSTFGEKIILAEADEPDEEYRYCSLSE